MKTNRELAIEVKMEECHIFLHDFLQATQVIFKDTFMVHTALSQTKQESEKKT